MTIKEYRSLKSGDRVRHIKCQDRVETIEGNETEHGFFIREANSRGGWNTINERNCQYYIKAE